MASPQPIDASPSDAPRPRRDAQGRLLELPPALARNLWKPGVSANPDGRGGEFQKCKSLCRQKSEAAAKRMFELAYLNEIGEDGELAPVPINADKRIVYMASQWVYENAWGKAKEYDPSKEKDPNKPKFDPRLLSPQQLDIVEYALKLMVQATRAPGETTVIEQPAADQVEEPSVSEGEDYYEDVQVSE